MLSHLISSAARHDCQRPIASRIHRERIGRQCHAATQNLPLLVSQYSTSAATPVSLRSCWVPVEEEGKTGANFSYRCLSSNLTNSCKAKESSSKFICLASVTASPMAPQTSSLRVSCVCHGGHALHGCRDHLIMSCTQRCHPENSHLCAVSGCFVLEIQSPLMDQAICKRQLYYCSTWRYMLTLAANPFSLNARC